MAYGRTLHPNAPFTPERRRRMVACVLGDGCNRSRDWHKACDSTCTTVKKPRSYRPQTDGKVERFRRILLEGRAYIRSWTSETRRGTRVFLGSGGVHERDQVDSPAVALRTLLGVGSEIDISRGQDERSSR